MNENTSALGIKERKCTILIDHDLGTRILNIIDNSKEYCFIVTPYIDLFKYWEHFTRILKEVSIDKKRIVFILKQIDENDEKDREKLEKRKEEKKRL
jgi:hypothetical protein